MTATTLAGPLIEELAAGRVPWQLLGSFPAEPAEDRALTERATQNLLALLDSCVDADRVESERQLPPEYYQGIRGGGFLRLQLAPAEGGLGLSDHGTARLLVAAMRRCVPAGYVLAIHNGIGLPSLLPMLTDSPLRRLVLDRLADGALSGWADTEPTGAGNTLSATTAVPAAGGGYRLTGQKAYIGNGTVAGELVVSATLAAGPPGTGERADAGLFLVDTRSAGFRVRGAHELVGLKGLPLGTLELAGVRVAPERVVEGPGGHWRDNRMVDALASRGRIYLLTAPALAIGQNCVQLQRDFARRRRVDGRPLADYPATRQLMARSLADLYAIDSLLCWGLLGEDALLGRNRDRFATKNLATMACWRIVERTLSLLAAGGLETGPSKQRWGAEAEPMERMWRDARVLRIAGAVDYAIDLWIGEALLDRRSPSGPGPAAAVPVDARLDQARAAELARLGRDAHRLATAVDVLGRRHPDRAELGEQQGALIATGRIANELLAMTVLLARVADAPPASATRQQRLAGVYCADARRRLTSSWLDLEEGGGSAADDRAAIAGWWTADTPGEPSQLENTGQYW